MAYYSYFLVILVNFCLFSSSNAVVNITIDDSDVTKVTIWNDLISFKFKAYCMIDALFVNGTSIRERGVKSWYLQGSVGDGKLFNPESVYIVEQTDSRVHFYWLQENDTTFTTELHYILEDGLSGLYSYIKFTNDHNETKSVGLASVKYRFNHSIFTQGTNQIRTGALPTPEELENCTEVLDATCQFPNGTYYTKYEWANYIREMDYHGLFGNGHGAFIITPSNEYTDGGAMRQSLTVQQVSLMGALLTSGKFQIGSPLSASPGWQHIYGPFLLYFPTGESDDEIFDKLKNQVKIEKELWPYEFVNDTEYPLERGSISGYVEGQKNATISVYDSLDEDHDIQRLGYLFTANTDSNGYYFIDKVRPGTYRVLAYPLAGLGCDSEAEDFVNITAGEEAQVNLTLTEPENIIWSLGECNRRASEFKYAMEERNFKYHLIIPENLTFIIGESDPANDWYYAQTQSGSRWRIQYNDTYNKKTRKLRIALAAISHNPHLTILFNDHGVTHWLHDNDHSVYRCALQSGAYVYHEAIIKAVLVKDGINTVEFFLPRGEVMYDAISLQRV